MQILIKIAFILFPVLVSGQISFYKYYAGNGFDFGQGIVQLEDSSYVVTGSSGSYADHSQAFLMATDSIGNWKWSNNFGGPESEWGRRVLHKKNFGYFLCGHSNSFGAGDFDFYLVKVAEDGLEEWSRTYGGSSWERVMDAAMTRDTGTVLVGERNNGLYGNDMYIVRTNSVGDTLWTKTFANMGTDIANAVSIYDDSIIVVGGNHFFADSLQVKPIMYMMHDDGTMIDTMIYSNYPGDYELNDLQVLGDTAQAIGSYQLNAADQWDYTFYRIEINPSGFLTEFVINSEVDGDWHGDVFTAYNDNSQRYMSFSFENNANTFEGGRDIMVQRGNTFMFYQATVAFLAMEEPDVNGEMIRTSDGGAIIVGYHQNTLIGSGGGTIFLYKIGPGEVYPGTTGILGFNQLVGLETKMATLNANVFPNPTTGLLNIELPTETAHTITLVDAQGSLIFEDQLNQSGTLSLQGVASGVYLIRIQNETGFYINRIIVQ